jgi:hypothetical protein
MLVAKELPVAGRFEEAAAKSTAWAAIIWRTVLAIAA